MAEAPQEDLVLDRKYDDDDDDVLFGALHIEKSLLLIHGDIIKGSGLIEILDANELSVVGTNAIENVNDIKKARYCLQVSVCAIYRKLKEGHLESNSILPVMYV